MRRDDRIGPEWPVSIAGLRVVSMRLFRYAAFGIAVIVALAGTTLYFVTASGPVLPMATAMTFATPATPRWKAAGRQRPIVAIVGDNNGTETTDFLVPFGVLSRSGVADVVAVSRVDGPLQLMPALTVRASHTLESFDARSPSGADYVIIPALHDRTNPFIVDWIRAQSAKGATLIAICDGTWTLAATGLLEGRQATGHWYSRAKLLKTYPTVRWVDGVRFVRDGRFQTSTGVSASIPASLALVEEIGGAEVAARTAAHYGVASWTSEHDSRSFRLTPERVLTLAWNKAAFWKHEKVGVPITSGVDETTLALTADALSRTYRSKALVTSATAGDIPTAYGLLVIPDLTGANVQSVSRSIAPVQRASLDAALEQIGDAYGPATRDWVSLQLEYADKR
jgi:putative intracellular protease/amidase